jgi:hypothetical protein
LTKTSHTHSVGHSKSAGTKSALGGATGTAKKTYRHHLALSTKKPPQRCGQGRLRMSDRTLRLWYMVIWSGYDNPSLIAANLRNMSAKRVARIIKLRIGYDPGMTESAWWEANQQRYWNSWFRWSWKELFDT